MPSRSRPEGDGHYSLLGDGAGESGAEVSVSRYLLLRLRELGVRHVFGTPGDYVLPFFEELEQQQCHGVEHVQPCNELDASYAAAGYALRSGYGAAAVTYGPGGLSTANGVAGACSDDIPMLVVSGAPAASALATVPASGRVIHHAVGTDLDAFLCVFTPITVRATRVESAEDAPGLIDSVLTDSFLAKKPAYLEIPVDLQTALVAPPAAPLELTPQSAPAAMQRAVQAAAAVISSAPRRVLVTGHLLLRNGATDALLRLARKLQATIATTLSCKHGDLEDSQHAVGLYCGALSRDTALAAVEWQSALDGSESTSAESASDSGQQRPEQTDRNERHGHSTVVITVGLTNNEMDTGRFSSNMDRGHTVKVHHSHVVVDGQLFSEVYMAEFLQHMTEACGWSWDDALIADQGPARQLPVFQFDQKLPLQCARKKAITTERALEMIAHYLRPNDVVYPDVTSALACSQIGLPRGAAMYGIGNWMSTGASLGYMLGGSFVQRPDAAGRLVAIEGDGGLQMCVQEVSTLIRHGRDAVLFIFNNHGYAILRSVHPGVKRSYNDIQDWKYHLLGAVFGGQGAECQGMEVRTEAELQDVLASLECVKGVNIVNIHVPPDDLPTFARDFMHTKPRLQSH